MIYTEADLKELEDFFDANRPLPCNVKVRPGITVRDADKFISSHLNVLRNYIGRSVFFVFFLHLLEYKEVISGENHVKKA